MFAQDTVRSSYLSVVLRCFSLPKIHTNPGAHPASCINLHRVTFLWVKQREREVNLPPPSSAKVKNKWMYTSTPPRSLYGVDWENTKLCFNPLTPNDPYRGRTASLTSKRCILYIYSTNTAIKYFNPLALQQDIYSLAHHLCKM